MIINESELPMSERCIFAVHPMWHPMDTVYTVGRAGEVTQISTSTQSYQSFPLKDLPVQSSTQNHFAKFLSTSPRYSSSSLNLVVVLATLKLTLPNDMMGNMSHKLRFWGKS